MFLNKKGNFLITILKILFAPFYYPFKFLSRKYSVSKNIKREISDEEQIAEKQGRIGFFHKRALKRLRNFRETNREAFEGSLSSIESGLRDLELIEIEEGRNFAETTNQLIKMYKEEADLFSEKNPNIEEIYTSQEKQKELSENLINISKNLYDLWTNKWNFIRTSLIGLEKRKKEMLTDVKETEEELKQTEEELKQTKEEIKKTEEEKEKIEKELKQEEEKKLEMKV